MPDAPIQAEEFSLHVERFYAGLISAAESRTTVSRAGNPATDSGLEPEPSLGGQLLYAGELDAEARALTVAANIAGAATLTASADATGRKQAQRDGVVDFLVTSLDEALRILKNELRKRETVAVCVAAAPEIVEAEMRERGVVPDLVRPAQLTAPEQGHALLLWRVASAPALWLPKTDAIASDCLDSEAGKSCRWLRLAPRYLGRMAQGVRVLRCAPEIAKEFMACVQLAVQRREIEVQVFVRHSLNGETILVQSEPPTGLEAPSEG